MKTPLASQRTVTGDHPPAFAWTGLQPWCSDPTATAPLSIRHCTGPIVDKYAIGTSLMQSPFFLLAHTLAQQFLPTLADGYSKIYQVFNIISSIFYFGLGSVLTLFLLFRYFDDFTSVLSSGLALFATSVFNYGTCEGSMSHIYSFAAVAGLAVLTLNYRAAASAHPAWERAIPLGACLGLVTILRIPNAVIGILPLAILAERLLTRRSPKAVFLEGIAIAGAFVVVFMPQALYWHSRTGQWLVNSYSLDDPGFYWLSPHLLDFTVGVRKGLFVWAPCLLAVPLGLILFARRDRTLALAIASVLALHIYICASWWNWWFGAGYGSRPFVDLVPLAALPLAAFVRWFAQRAGRRVVTFGAVALVCLNLFLTVSYWHSYLPADGTTIGDILALPARWVAPG